MRIVLTGGGTGGHVVPNFAVIEGLRKEVKDLKPLYIGSVDGVERQLVKDFGVDFEGVRCGKLRRYFSWDNFVDLFRVPVGVWQSRRILRRFKPDVVFSKGGYVSVPVVVAAYLMRIPVVCHESDVQPGLATRISYRFAKKVCLSFEESREYMDGEKVVVTGNPVREMVSSGKKARGLEFCDFNDGKPVLLVMGGSQGARQINNLIEENIDALLKKWQIAHIRGPGNMKIGLERKGYKQFEYVDGELPDLYAIADLVVSRGGANSLAELASLHKKVVVIPLGMASSRGDQIDNAKIYVRRLGWVLGAGPDFVETLDLTLKGHLEKNSFENGVEKIVREILKTAK